MKQLRYLLVGGLVLSILSGCYTEKRQALVDWSREIVEELKDVQSYIFIGTPTNYEWKNTFKYIIYRPSNSWYCDVDIYVKKYSEANRYAYSDFYYRIDLQLR